MNLFPVIDESKSIFLSGDVPSSKNSKEIGFFFVKEGETSNWFFNMKGTLRGIRPTLRSSEVTEAYVKMIVPQIINNKKRFKELVEGKPNPLVIQLHFVRKTHGRWDFHNLVQAVADSISGSYWKHDKQIPHIATQWIKDDDVSNALFIPPLTGEVYTVDKTRPGVWITPL